MQIITIVSFLLWLYTSKADVPYCVATPGIKTPGLSDPPFPQLPDTFQCRVEANIIDKRMTVSAQEYFDNRNDRATLIMYSDGHLPDTLVYDYANNQLFYVHAGLCQTNTLSSDPNNYLFGNKLVDGHPHTFSSNGALHFMQEYGQTYMGRTTVRGITVDHWRTCLNWPSPKASFYLDYYFTTTDWETAVDFVQLPVLAVASGTETLKNGTIRRFNHTYNYFEFRFDLTVDDSIFETPAGVVCPNRTKTKSLPSLPTSYRYRQEIVSNKLGTVQIADIYYDDDYKLVRYDYRNLAPKPPTYSTNPLSEVHDYNTGVRYIKDLVSGNCSILPLPNSTFDDIEAHGSFAVNGSANSTGYVLHMKNPIQFLMLDSSYTYTGQRKSRGGAVCDVFSGIRNDYIYEGKVRNATFEYYFLSNIYSEIPDDASGNDPIDVPFQLDIIVLDFIGNPGVTITYNFLDFSTGNQDISLFDVSTCYSSAANLQFQVRLPGTFYKSSEDYMKLKLQMLFAETMNVSYIRVQDLRIDYDNSNIYVSATLLDRTPAAAQFTFISGKAIEKHDDLQYTNITTPQQCAKYCVTNYDFVCNSFDFCPLGTGNCRLSKSHIGDGTAILSSSPCDHFSRTLNGPLVQEITVDQAYDNLRIAVYQKKFRAEIFGIQGIPGNMVSYYAVDIRVLFGWMEQTPIPSISGQFSYGLEIIVPSVQNVVTANVWYDINYKLVRYDMTNESPLPPFYTTTPITTIHDFNTGLAYNIDKSLGNCTITAITSGSDAKVDKAAQLKNDAYVVKMKSPLEYLSMSETYRWAGQRTVRGIMCDVFEATTTAFTVPSITQVFTSTLQFFFMSDNWAQTSDTGSTPVNSQPIQLIVSSAEVGVFMTYNFYNFNEEDPDLRNFDITPCFTADQTENFVITFYGDYHTLLNGNLKFFQQQARLMMSRATKASPLRFQNLEVTYDNHGTIIFLIGTLVEQAPFIDDFTKTNLNMNPPQNGKSFTQIATSAECATACRQFPDFPCQGFYYCGQSQTCVLSKNHADTGSTPNSALTCDHYSRTINSTSGTQPTIKGMFTDISNLVYRNAFSIVVSIGNTKQTQQFNASSARTGVLRNGRQDESNALLSHFSVSRKNYVFVKDDKAYAGTSVEQCAQACMSNLDFQCQSFSYCFDLGDCFISKVHPDNATGLIHAQDYCDLYTRNFLDIFTSSGGKTYSVKADAVLTNMPSANLCAKNCAHYHAFSCKSFEYCNNTKTCNLMKTHEVDLPPSSATTSLTCSFYSLNYLFDFQLMAKKTMTFTNALEYSGISNVQCAKLCVEQGPRNCKSFAYCGTTCRLTAQHPRQSSVMVTESATCDLYSRRFFPPPGFGMSPLQGNSQTSKSSTGYSGGSMAALGLCMIILGIALGAAGLYLFNKRRQLHTDETINMTEHFENENYEPQNNEVDSS